MKARRSTRVHLVDKLNPPLTCCGQETAGLVTTSVAKLADCASCQRFLPTREAQLAVRERGGEL
jgi:hypothetical protein